jgi:hypothetical protein
MGNVTLSLLQRQALAAIGHLILIKMPKHNVDTILNSRIEVEARYGDDNEPELFYIRQISANKLDMIQGGRGANYEVYNDETNPRHPYMYERIIVKEKERESIRVVELNRQKIAIELNEGHKKYEITCPSEYEVMLKSQNSGREYRFRIS